MWFWLAVIGLLVLITLSVVEMVIKYKRANGRTVVIMVDGNEERRKRYLEQMYEQEWVIERRNGYQVYKNGNALICAPIDQVREILEEIGGEMSIMMLVHEGIGNQELVGLLKQIGAFGAFVECAWYSDQLFAADDNSSLCSN